MYHLKLNLPVNFTPIPVDFTNKNHVVYNLKNINFELKDFLFSLGVTILNAEVFYKNENTKNGIHIDNNKPLNNFVKLNYVYGGGDSLMKWYQLKKDRSIKMAKTVINTSYQYALEQDVDEVYTVKIEGPSLVNVGILHGITNVTSPRTCYSLILGSKLNEQLEWNEALKLFKGYY
jgi:hypothetical protein